MNISKVSNSGVLGQAAAAEKNRQHRVRDSILKALGLLGIPHHEWPDFVRVYYADPSQPIGYRQSTSPSPFQPPPFDRLNESAEEWRKKADAQWEQHRDRFLQACDSWVELGVDEKIAPAKRTRGAGKVRPERKRSYTAIERRYEWAARRLCGEAWKEIAAKYQRQESTVIKAASAVLRSADWPTKPKADTSRIATP